MSMWCKTRDVCMYNCGVRVNALITAVVPAIDYLQGIFPTLQAHLPANVYSLGFIVMAIANTLLHVKVPLPDRDKLL